MIFSFSLSPISLLRTSANLNLNNPLISFTNIYKQSRKKLLLQCWQADDKEEKTRNNRFPSTYLGWLNLIAAQHTSLLVSTMFATQEARTKKSKQQTLKKTVKYRHRNGRSLLEKRPLCVDPPKGWILITKCIKILIVIVCVHTVTDFTSNVYNLQ